MHSIPLLRAYNYAHAQGNYCNYTDYNNNTRTPIHTTPVFYGGPSAT